MYRSTTIAVYALLADNGFGEIGLNKSPCLAMKKGIVT